MDDDARVARFLHRQRTADQLFNRAEARTELADRLQARLDDPTTISRDDIAHDVARLRDEAIELEREAQEAYTRLFERPSDEMIREVDEWAKRMANLGSRERDSDDDRER